jgi:imidazolonepropionase-like amidohydrolase
MLIVDATLWDGTGAEPRRGMALRTEGERIAWIGPSAAAPKGDATEDVVDAAGRWLLPGLIDLHVHLTADPRQSDFMRYIQTTPIPEQTLMGARNARLMLEAGFTSTRDLGATGFANVALKRAIDAGWVPGPRLVTCGEFLTVPGGHGDVTFRPDLGLESPHAIRGIDDARRLVREQIKRGADWIKLLATGGVMTGGTALGASLWEDDELRAAVGMARRLGKPVAAHCHGADGMVAVAEAGVSTIEHGTMADERAVEAMKRHGTTLVPTFSAAAGVVREAKAGRLPPAVAPQALAIEHSHAKAFRLAREAGVRIASGSDTGVPGTEFGGNAGELELLVGHGLTPAEAILAATRDAAQVLGWQDRLGTLEEGKLADLILVDGDPLSEIAVLKNKVRIVVKGGALARGRGAGLV